MVGLTRWDPFEEMDVLRRGLSLALTGTRNVETVWTPAAEVTSGDEAWTIKMALPGVDPKDVEVNLDHHVLRVAGERQRGETREGARFSELGYGRFERRFTLPRDVDSEKVTAAFDKGMLVLTLPRVESARPRRIAIGAGAADSDESRTKVA